MFNDLDINGVEEQQDRLGGTYTLETGVYDGVIKLAYVMPSNTSKSKCIVTVIEYEGKEITDRTWFLNKEGKPTYDKNGKKFMLPGYELINDLCLCAAGTTLKDVTVADKTIKVWDGNEGKEVEKSMPVLTDLLGKPVTGAITKVTENKQVKDDASGQYVDTEESREVNETSKFFHTGTRKTVIEATKGIDLPVEELFISKWAEKNSGNTRNDFKSPAGSAPAAGQGAPKTKTSLFS